MSMTIEALRQGLVEHDKGVLKGGMHKPEDREFCALEFSSIMRGKTLTDSPGDLPDLRPLNDAPWPNDTARTAALLPVMVALWDWREWSSKRQAQWAQRVVIDTVRRIISELPGLSDLLRIRCHAGTTLNEVKVEAAETEAEAGAWVATGAWAATAAEAAAWAAGAAKTQTPESVLVTACDIFIQAAQGTEGL